MTDNEITTMRTELANKFAEAGAAYLEFTGTGAALAPIDGTNPQQYAAAGTLETIRRIWPQDEAAATVLTDEQIVEIELETVKIWPSMGEVSCVPVYAFARSIERAVLAHAGKAEAQVAAGIEGLTRYDIEHDGCGWMRECVNGDYVKFADVERLLAQAGVTAEPAEPLTIALGQGLIEIGQGHHGDERLPAILFGRNGAGAVGVETEGNRIMEPGECIAAITFRNRASLEVVAEKLDELRARIWPENAPAVKPWQERVREDKSVSSFNACLAEIDEHRAKATPAAQVPAAEVRAAAIESLGSVIKKAVHVLPFDIAGALLAAFGEVAHQSTADSAGTGAMGEKAGDGNAA